MRMYLPKMMIWRFSRQRASHIWSLSCLKTKHHTKLSLWPRASRNDIAVFENIWAGISTNYQDRNNNISTAANLLSGLAYRRERQTQLAARAWSFPNMLWNGMQTAYYFGVVPRKVSPAIPSFHWYTPSIPLSDLEFSFGPDLNWSNHKIVTKSLLFHEANRSKLVP